jgi:hypothetical protein
MPDSSAVDAAVISRLVNDATLQGLMPDGVYWDVAAHGKTRFVIVSQVIHEDEAMFDGDAFERFTYLVKAVEKTTTGANIQAATARIQTLLHRATFLVTGYGLMSSRRVERIRYTEVDEVNADVRWQHRGGRYEVWCSPA